MQVRTVLDHIDLGSMALPEFQRGYVWNREQVRGLMNSLYRKHPVGTLLVWVTKTELANARGDGSLSPGYVKLLLDGQQRITSLYGIIRGKPPKFFDGSAQAFTGLHFNLDEEAFEFYAPAKMKGNPLWIDVTELLQVGAGKFIGRLYRDEVLAPKADVFSERVNALDQIKEIDLHVEEVTGEDKTVDIVVDIFNQVNSGGTKLSKGDLALAKICASWPDAREEMKTRIAKWRKAGFDFRLEWLLRCINTIVTGEALFAALKDVSIDRFRQGLVEAEKRIDQIIDLIASRLGLDHDRVLGSRYSFPLLARYLSQRGGRIADHRERDGMLYWYVHTFLWGRYAGSTESVLNQDLRLIEEDGNALQRLIDQLRQNRGDLRLQPNDFIGWSQGARFYPLLYMLTRVWHAKDWGSGVELSNHLLGHMSKLELHHVFPKDLLYKHGYGKAEVNALANFTFLTKETNLQVSNRDPGVYLPEFVAKNPGAVESHWIPMDPELWRIDRFRGFLARRRELLADAANTFLDSLVAGAVPEKEATPSVLTREVTLVPGRIETEEERQTVLACSDWVVKQGLPGGEFEFELADPATGDVLAILDLAWPEGLQPQLSTPVAVLIDEAPETLQLVSNAGFRCFTDVEALKAYVRRDVLGVVFEVE